MISDAVWQHAVNCSCHAFRLAMGTALAACTTVVPPSGGGDSAIAGPDVLVEIRGEWAPRVERVTWSGEACAVESDDEDAAEVFAAWRMRCRGMSLDAFDELRRASDGCLPIDDEDREWLQVVPSPDGALAVIRGPGTIGSSWQLVDVQTAAQRPWPASLQSSIVYPLAWSGDGRRLALHVKADRRDDSPWRLVVLDPATGAIVLDRAGDHMELAWGPDGTHLAMLARNTQQADGLLDKVGAAFGHGPGYHSDFELVILDLVTGHESRLRVAEHIRSGRGRLLWDTQAVGFVAGDFYNGSLPGREP